MAEAFIVGQVARLPILITDLSGQAVDPGAVTLKIKPGAGAIDAYVYGDAAEIVRDATGSYHADIELTVAGRWFYRWELAAPNAGVAEGCLTVQPSRFVA